ncbi:hypothetical protein ACHAWT_009783 [Skeletonema menzelii]|eukprot:scaffold1698_cov149-Skeletonema_menzelii.AAC.11
MMLLSTVTTFLALLIVALVSSTAAADGEYYGLRNFDFSAIPPFNNDSFGECTIADDCAEKQKCKISDYGCFCVKAAGDCDGKGKCKEIKLALNKSYRPVCGCDGTTYSIESEAHKHGINVKATGPCISSDVVAAAE